jgi:hypothetical protein
MIYHVRIRTREEALPAVRSWAVCWATDEAVRIGLEGSTELNGETLPLFFQDPAPADAYEGASCEPPVAKRGRGGRHLYIRHKNIAPYYNAAESHSPCPSRSQLLEVDNPGGAEIVSVLPY